jgi:hypothetical protein
MAEGKKSTLGKEISMDIKDSFFDDPFFRDWWNDFDAPMKDKTLQRQISGKLFTTLVIIMNMELCVKVLTN